MGSTIKSHFTSGMHSPVAEKKEEDGETEEVNEGKTTEENGNVTDTLRSRGSTAKLYVSNLLKSKRSVSTNENSPTDKDPEKQPSSRFSNIFQSKPKSNGTEEPQKPENKKVSSKFSSLLKFKSQLTKSESAVERIIEPEKQKSSKLSETLKAKGSNAKSFMVNVIHSKSKEESSGEANDPKSDEKSKAGEFLRSKGSAVHSYLSKVRGDMKQKQVVTASKDDSTSKASLLKEKGAAGKDFVLNIFKRENCAGNAAAGAASEVKKGAPASASIIGHYPKSFASTNKDNSSAETVLKSDTS